MKAIIIDDEPHCRNVIVRVLEKHCPDLVIAATCADGIEGLKAIVKYQPDVVFLDIEMPRMNGFQMLESLGNEDINFTLIFTTAYDKFAVQAFKFWICTEGVIFFSNFWTAATNSMSSIGFNK